MKGGVTRQSNYIWKQLDGIGESKAESRAESDIYSQSGQAVSVDTPPHK